MELAARGACLKAGRKRVFDRPFTSAYTSGRRFPSKMMQNNLHIRALLVSPLLVIHIHSMLTLCHQQSGTNKPIPLPKEHIGQNFYRARK